MPIDERNNAGITVDYPKGGGNSLTSCFSTVLVYLVLWFWRQNIALTAEPKYTGKSLATYGIVRRLFRSSIGSLRVPIHDEKNAGITLDCLKGCGNSLESWVPLSNSKNLGAKPQ